MIDISGITRIAAVIGDPVRHSRSPQIHNAAFRHLGLDWVYLALPVSAGRGAAAVAAMRTLGIDGLSVTMPHKADVAAAVDRRTPAVEALGACNCVYRDGDVLVGDNTDGLGFIRSLEAEAGFSLDGATIAVVGAGGAARSIIDAAARNGAARVLVINRTPAGAERAAAIHPSVSVAEVTDLAAADIIVNATSVGMAGGPAPDQLPFPAEFIQPHHLVADIVYQPERTPLLVEAEARGAATIGGLGMLVHQAAVAFEHWTGQPAPIEVMLDAVRRS